MRLCTFLDMRTARRAAALLLKKNSCAPAASLWESIVRKHDTDDSNHSTERDSNVSAAERRRFHVITHAS